MQTKMEYKEANKTRIYMEARSSISHGKTTVSVFVAVNYTPKALKSQVPFRQRVYILVLKVFCSNKTEGKSISSEKHARNLKGY